MRNARNATGFFRHFVIHQMSQVPLVTSSDVVDEIWAALCYFAEVPDAGKELLKSRGIPAGSADDAYVSFQSFLRQSRAFFSAARELEWRSSPLIYYYSFLNLAKALLCLKWPDRVKDRISHGLSHKLNDGPLEAQLVSVVDGGVFPLLYELLLGEKLRTGLTFDVLTLLAYCTDVAHEVASVKDVKIRTMYGKSRLHVLDPTDAYGTLAIRRFDIFETCKSAKQHFYQTFEEVNPTKDSKRHEFGLFAEEAADWRFFETVKTVTRADAHLLSGICHEALRPFLLEHPYQQEHCDFALCCPLPDENEVLFNEIASIYATIFFLSSLVRYYPRYFESAPVSKDVWMIDIFIRSAPVTLLRYMANRVFGENRQFAMR